MAELKDVFVYDLMAKLRSDPKRAREVQEAVDNVGKIQRQVAAGKAERGAVSKEMARVISASGFNFGLLLPHIFPRYPTTAPLSLIQRPFMFAMMNMAANIVLTLRAGRQVGKCADATTEIETESHGTLTMGQLFDMGVRTDSSASS